MTRIALFTLGTIKNQTLWPGWVPRKIRIPAGRLPLTLGVTKNAPLILGMIKNDPFTLGVTKDDPFTLGIAKEAPFTI